MNSSTRRSLMDKLYRDTEFAKLASNIERIEYIFKACMSYEQFESAIKANIEAAKQKAAKDIATAQGYKKMADRVMVNANLLKMADRPAEVRRALEAYTQAIIFAPHNEAEMLADLYSRKALMHIELGEHEAALYAVELALEIENNQKLVLGDNNDGGKASNNNTTEYLVLKFNCLKLMQDYVGALALINEIIELPEKDEENFPDHVLVEMKQNVEVLMREDHFTGAATTSVTGKEEEPFFGYKFDPRCKIQQSAVVGRHFIALEDIPEGTVLLKEKPYSIVIETEYMHKKCSNCYKDLKHKLYPCHHCTDLIFCSSKCYHETYKLFHRYECGVITALKQITSPSFHVFRMISRIGPLEAFKAEATKDGYSVEKYLEDASHRDVPEVYKKPAQRFNSYQMSSLLWDHDSKHSFQSNVHHTVVGIEVAVLLDIVHDYRDKAKHIGLPEDYTSVKFIDMVVVDTRRIIFNVFGWHEYNEDWTLRGHVANCQCLVGSLINHSCVPNTNWEFENGQIKFITNQKIPAGGEITITYGPNKDVPYSRRQERLNHYFFACKCAACVADARKDNSLKCLNCSGPVLFDSVVNQEPHLSGKCLECFQKYKNFDDTLRQFKKAKEMIKELEVVSYVSHDPQVATQAVQQTKRVLDLAGYSNNELLALVSACSQVVERVHGPGGRVSEILKYGYFIDEFFPLELKLDNITDQTLQTLHYWFDRFMAFIIELHNNPPLLAEHDECQVWNTLFQFHYRVQCLLKAQPKKIGDEDNSITKLAKKIFYPALQANELKLENLKQAYATNVSFSA